MFANHSLDRAIRRPVNQAVQAVNDEDVAWGEHDAILSVQGVHTFQKGPPLAEVEVVEGGHFAFESKSDEPAAASRDVLARPALKEYR